MSLLFQSHRQQRALKLAAAKRDASVVDEKCDINQDYLLSLTSGDCTREAQFYFQQNISVCCVNDDIKLATIAWTKLLCDIKAASCSADAVKVLENCIQLLLNFYSPAANTPVFPVIFPGPRPDISAVCGTEHLTSQTVSKDCTDKQLVVSQLQSIIHLVSTLELCAEPCNKPDTDNYTDTCGELSLDGKEYTVLNPK